MQSHISINVGDIVVFRSYKKFGLGLVLGVSLQKDVLFADTLWQDGIIIKCNVFMLELAR